MFTSTISCLSWSNLSTTYWPGPALWYGSIILALTSIIVGAQQAMFMPDTVDTEAAQEFRRRHIANNGSEKRPEPRQIMLFVWQAPLMCLSYSIVFFLAGLTSVVLSPLAQRPGWNAEAKVCASILRQRFPLRPLS